MKISIDKIRSSFIKIFRSNQLQAGKQRLMIHAAILVAIAAALMLAAPGQHAQQVHKIAPLSDCFSSPLRDVAFVIDRSGSVGQRGQTYNIQIEGALRALRDPSVIPRDGSVAVSIILFGENATINVPLTVINSATTAETVAFIIEGLRCKDVGLIQPPCPFGGTSFASAILTANVHLNQNRRLGAHRVIIISTDGETSAQDIGVAQGLVEQARLETAKLGIPFEVDAIFLGVAAAAPDFAPNKAKVDSIVTPPPASALPGATLVIPAGPCNLPGASFDSADCDRQANDFVENVRRVLRSEVQKIDLVVNTIADVAPDTPVPGGSNILTLRQAIEIANCNGGATTITFAAAVKGQTIKPTVPLPALTQPDITIDGCDGEGCAPGITIDGSGVNAEASEQHGNGILIRSNRNVVRGLRIINFKRAGVGIEQVFPFDNVSRNRVERNSLENNTLAGVIVTELPSSGAGSGGGDGGGGGGGGGSDGGGGDGGGGSGGGKPTSLVANVTGGGGNNICNTISRNTISGSATLIDLGGDGPTPNDPGDLDTGPNTLLNFPDQLNATVTNGAVTVTGVTSGPTVAGATVEIFGATQVRVVSDLVVIDGVRFLASAVANGDGTFAATNVPASPTGVYTATVTDFAGNTSELMFDSATVHPARPVATITTPINFGEVKVNVPSQAKQIVIINTGNAPLIVTRCVVQKCNPQDRDDTAAFSISNCPTAPINPGQQVTLNVIFTPKGCGAAQACLALESNIPLQQPLQSQLTGEGTGFAEAKVALEGGAANLQFGPVRARAKSRNLNKRPLRTFTIQNVGCDTLTLTGVAINRIGRAVDNGRITSTDDSKFFSVSIVNADGSEASLAASLPLNIAQGQSRTFRVRFNPVIPPVADRTRGLSADFVLPETLTSQVTITQAGGVSSTIPLVASISNGVQMINPADPTLAPQVTLTRLGDDIVVDFSAHDPNLDVTRATYAFFDSAGRAIDQPIEIDLTQAIAESNLVEGQSFTISHRFTGGARRVASVRVTVFDRGSSDTAASGAGASASGAVSPSSAQRFTLLLPAVKIGSRLD